MYNKNTECKKMRNTSELFKKMMSVILSIFLVFPITNAYNLHTELEKFFDIYNKTSQNLDNTEETWDNFWYLIYLYINIKELNDPETNKNGDKFLIKLKEKLIEIGNKINRNINKPEFIEGNFLVEESNILRDINFDNINININKLKEFLKKFNSQETYEITEEQRKFIDSIDNYSMPVIITNDNEPEYTQAKIISISDDCSDGEDMDFSSNSTATRVFRNTTKILRYPEEHVSFTRCFRSSDDEHVYIVKPKNKIIKKRSNLKENFETAGILTGLVTVFSAGTYVISKSIRNIYQEIVKDKNNNKLQKRV